ncbi:MAG: ATP dependent DNA ligase [uncultured bacterium]|nr:MAG: ATP dependent DNA ligase [uncultured bacterium]
MPSANVQPMRCCDVDLSKVQYPIMGFPKLDGVRLINLNSSATARTLIPHQNKFITKKFSDLIYTGIDGEATMGSITGQSLCRDTSSVMSTITGEPNIVWYAFDFLREDVIGLVYENRYKALVKYVKQHKPPGVKVLEFKMLYNEEQVLSFYKECLIKGYEGIVLRDPHGVHKNGRCTANEANYTRMKPSSDKEALVLELVEAKANLNEKKKNALGLSERSSHKANKVGKGMIGMMRCLDLTTKSIIDVGPGKMTHEERIYFWNNPSKLINHYIKYRSTDVGVMNKPRFARYICIRDIVDIVL